MGDRNGCGFATHLKKLDDSSGREFFGLNGLREKRA